MSSKQTVLYESPTVRIIDYCCGEPPNSISSQEIADEMEITYTRSGYFTYHGYKQKIPVDNTVLLLKNKDSEHKVTHGSVVRDTCTAFQFSRSLLNAFSFPVSAVPVNPRLDYLHGEIFGSLMKNRPDSLRLDVLAIHFLEETLNLANIDPFVPNPDSEKLRTRHRDAIERAKLFMTENFTRDLTLKEIAKQALVSEFHFSRIFRTITSRSPHQFLLDLRFHHAALLLRETSRPVTDICYECGFNHLAHFITTFTRRYRLSPLQYRKRDI